MFYFWLIFIIYMAIIIAAQATRRAVESCENCGGPIDTDNRVFCGRCWEKVGLLNAYPRRTREEPHDRQDRSPEHLH